MFPPIPLCHLCPLSPPSPVAHPPASGACLSIVVIEKNVRKLRYKIDKIKKVELLAQKMAQCIALFPETLFRKLCKFFSRGIVSQVPEANTICRAGCHPSRLLQTIGPPCAMRCNAPLPFKQTLGPCLLPKIRSTFGLFIHFCGMETEEIYL